MKIYEVITEAFDNPYPINWFQKTQEVWEGSVQLPDGSKLFIDITESDEGYYAIEFAKSDTKGMGATMKATGTGDEFRIFATVQAGILEWWNSVDEDDVQKITFNASKHADDSKNRYKLYARFAKQWANKIGWVATSREEDGGISFVLMRPAAAKFAKDQDLEVMEGVNDPGIFKAVFLAGGPGSGKSFVVRDTGVASSMGLKLLNSDSAFETYMRQAEIEPTPDNIMSPAGQELRDKAKNVVKKQTGHYMNERLGLVLDGTGKDYDKITSQATRLKKIGYDVAMVFVNTDIETALDRNEKRKRSLPEDMITQMWKDVQMNIGKFQSYFNQNMYIMDNSDSADSGAGTNEIYKRLTQFIKSPPKSGIAQNWIKKQQSSR
jgi:dephospho-CoA kinase